jgi:hypothetical protein
MNISFKRLLDVIYRMDGQGQWVGGNHRVQHGEDRRSQWDPTPVQEM